MIFLLFGIHANRSQSDGLQESVAEWMVWRFPSVFLLIDLAESKEITQLAVATLASTSGAVAVLLRATWFCPLTPVSGIWVERTILRWVPIDLLCQIVGYLF